LKAGVAIPQRLLSEFSKEVRPYAAQRVLDGAWRHLALDHVFGESPEVERAAFALAAYGLMAGQPTVKVTDWIQRDFAVPRARFSPSGWRRATQLLGEQVTWDAVERAARAGAGNSATYLVGDPSAARDGVALVVCGDRWPVLLPHWPQPDSVVFIRPAEAAGQLAAELASTEWPGHGSVSYQRLPYCQVDGPGARRLVVERGQVSQVIDVSGDELPDDDKLVIGYLSAEEVNRKFNGLLNRQPKAPFTGSGSWPAAWLTVSWLALLLTRQVEHDADRPWPDILTELQRLHEVTLTLAGVNFPLRTAPSPDLQRLLDRYESG
jgi:hypothetical protein